jgi:hypothetical protein
MISDFQGVSDLPPLQPSLINNDLYNFVKKVCKPVAIEVRATEKSALIFFSNENDLKKAILVLDGTLLKPWLGDEKTIFIEEISAA